MKKVIITLLSIIFIISMITSVYAATGSINFGASSDTVIKGKTFTVTVEGTADSNITGMQAGLSYDTNKLSIESKTVGQGYFDASSSNEIAIGSTSAENLSQAGTLYTITFKVLDTATKGETKISLTNAVLATVDGQLEASNKEVIVTIDVDKTGADEGEGEKNTNNTANNDVANNNTANNESNNKNETKKNATKNTSKKKYPQTGVENTTVFAIIVLGVVAIASFISYKKYKNI